MEKEKAMKKIKKELCKSCTKFNRESCICTEGIPMDTGKVVKCTAYKDRRKNEKNKDYSFKE